ncbi:MAG: tol-pal system-associated acyl-CoA thioesterase [Gammaproteobacteria bacterium]|nr:tol-pal system-associated acyl-CoA thioesterase [Gammaproteobacteria bacterium]
MFSWPIRVYYEDTDAGGVVYHASYLAFMERARTEWLRSLELEQDQLILKHQLIFAVRSLTIDYLKPALFNEALVVESSIIKLGKASILFQQQIVRKMNDSSELLIDATVKIAAINAQGETKKAILIPAEIYQIFSASTDSN